MEGGGVRGGFPFGNTNNFQGEPIPRPLRPRRPPPPLAAIDRFLWSDQNLFPEQEILTNFKNKTALDNPENFNVYSDFTSSVSQSGAINGHAASAGGVGVGGGVVPWLSLPHHDPSFADGILLNEQNRNWGGLGITPNVAFRDDEDNPERKNPRKREKGGSSANLIKGQWTEDEDRKLKKLVKNFGVKKWAQIAEQMMGRAGKQCRERWHNHLRPNIKKDTWSEEEERLLVEAHMLVGNKWAEIAKRIPCRTENSIKNHWNATKRRQNSRRKSKKPEGTSGKNQLTTLQQYIKSCTSNDSPGRAVNNVTPSQSVTPAPNSTVSKNPSSVHFNGALLFSELSQSTSDESASYLAQRSYDDEMNFMQNLFGNNNGNNVSSSLVENTKAKAPLGIKQYGNSIYNGDAADHYQGFAGNMGYGYFPSFLEQNQPIMKPHPQEQLNPASHAYSDLYMSNLLNGSNSLIPSHEGHHENMNIERIMIMDHHDQASAGSSSSDRKDVDLIEMVTNSHQFQPGTDNVF